MSLNDELCEPIKCTNCGAVSVNGGKLACWKCYQQKEEEINTIVERWEIEEKALNTEIERLNDEIEDREDAEQSWSNHVEELLEQCERYRVALEDVLSYADRPIVVKIATEALSVAKGGE